MELYDLVVVGAGAVGAAAAYHGARSGRRVLLLEQFSLGHARGSSHGESRIIRHSYSSVDYATLAPPAFEAWRALERESGAELLTMTGGIDLGHAGDPALLACRSSLEKAGFGSIWLEGSEARAFTPQFNLPDDWAVLWQSGAGILNAGRCVRTLAAQAIAHGATLVEHARVESVEPGERSAVVRFSSGGAETSVEARGVVIAAGPWASRFLGGLGVSSQVRVTHQQVVYYAVEDETLWARGRAPIYIAHGRDGFYGFPICERPGFIKVGIELDAEIPDPDVETNSPNFEALTSLNRIVSTIFKGVRPQPADVVTCRYTETADRDFLIDRHPRHPGIVFASPCSGHGFKFSILSGRLAAELATGSGDPAASPVWRSRFSLAKPSGVENTLATEWRG